MSKKKALFAVGLIALAAIPALAPKPAMEVMASSEETIVVSSSQKETVSSIVVTSSEAPKYEYAIKEAFIGYRDDDSASYAKGGSAIGSYFLSDFGWNEGDEYDVVMNVKGNITTKLDSKIVYIYEYRPTLVRWAGKEIAQNEDKTYTLKKPEAKGEYDLEICFTRTAVTNPMDLTSLNWASFLTVENLMVVGSWVVIVIGILVIFFWGQHQRKKGQTTLQEVKASLQNQIETVYGTTVAKQLGDLFEGTVKKIFTAIDSKLSKIDDNNAILVRCLLLMQEDTPEARLAITECLTKLDASEDELGSKVKELIEKEIEKYKKDELDRLEAIAKVQQSNGEWAKKAEPDAEAEEEDKDGYGKL